MTRSNNHILVPPRLPLLDALHELQNETNFSNTVLVGVQHLLASNASLLVKLHEAGLDYERMFLLGKIYSSSPLVADTLKKLGVFVHQGAFELNNINLRENYDVQLRKAADDLLVMANRRLRSQPKPRRLLVMDDGAVLITLLNHHRESIDAEVVAVEQTTSGIRRIEECSNVQFPIVDVARSQAKRLNESPIVASSIIQNLASKIQDLPVETKLVDADALVVGIGAVGMEVAKQLRDEVASVAVYDSNKGTLAAASKRDLCVVKLRDGLSRCHVIIGCVGKNWLPEDGCRLVRDGAVLASGSSSNVEFLGLDLVHEQEATGLELAHGDYLIKVQNGSAWVLSAGFPINFDGSPDPISPGAIQLTRALMLAGIYQAMESNPTKRGVIRLDTRLEGFVTRQHGSSTPFDT